MKQKTYTQQNLICYTLAIDLGGKGIINRTFDKWGAKEPFPPKKMYSCQILFIDKLNQN